jgi:hypothetical protein
MFAASSGIAAAATSVSRRFHGVECQFSRRTSAMRRSSIDKLAFTTSRNRLTQSRAMSTLIVKTCLIWCDEQAIDRKMGKS